MTASSFRMSMTFYILLKFLKLNFHYFTLLVLKKIVVINKSMLVIVNAAEIIKCNFPAHNKIELIKNVTDMFSLLG